MPFEIKSVIIILISFLSLFSCCLTILSRNLFFSIFSLVLFFFSSLWHLLFFNAEYIMVVFLILYLGAIIVFFLFVIMLLEKDLLIVTVRFNRNKILNTILYILCAVSFLLMISRSILLPDLDIFIFDLDDTFVLTNIERIGLLLYSEFGVLLILGASILLASIIGCIIILKIK